MCRLLLAISLAALPAAPDQTVTAGTLAPGTPHATPYVVRDSGVPGPTVLIIGGIHGNEPAGAYAAGQIRHWPLAKGIVVTIPRANETALRADSRYTPGVDEELRNLNRNFPRAKEGGASRGALAKAVWKLVRELNPSWLLDLHEGFDFGRINRKSVGSSIIAFPTAETLGHPMAREAILFSPKLRKPMNQFGQTRLPSVRGS